MTAAQTLEQWITEGQKTTKDGDGFPCGHLCIECQMAIKINKLAV
jgi:hypothetical protein